MKFAKTFNVMAMMKHEMQVLVYMTEASAYERAAAHLEEWVIVVVTRMPSGTWVHVEMPIASEEQAEQYLSDFDEAKALDFSETFKV